MTESVIDFPKDALCPEIWEKVVAADGMREVWQLKTEVRAKIQEVFEKIVEATQQHFNIVHITGSITSNSYTENADIDMHLLSDQYDADEARAEEINKMLRAAYKKVFIGKHPIEVYYQPNKFQDMMSVGCYDFFKNKWLVGPELADPSFNPYSEYYKEIHNKSEGLAQQIRNMIFSIYEIAVVMKKNIATEFGNNIRAVLVKKLEEVQALYDNIRQMRKVYSSPESEEQALQYRSLRKWKVADGAFKLFDKYGYMAILKQLIEDYKLIQDSHEVDIEVVDDILNTVKHYINNADKLAEKEIFDESIVKSSQLMTLFESWDPNFDDTPKNQYGEKWHKIDNNHWIFSFIDNVCRDCQIDPENRDPKVDRIYLYDIHEVEGNRPYYIVNFGGGANGGGDNNKWITYLALIKKVLAKIKKEFEKVWLIDLDNDCADDVWTLRIAVQPYEMETKSRPDDCPLESEKLDEDIDDKQYAYHVSNVPPEVIKKKGFKAGKGNGGTDRNMFDELYQQDYPKNYLFISEKPWDEDRTEKFKYCYKIDVTDLDFYPDFGMLIENGAYYEETEDDYVFYWRDKDLKFMKNKQLKSFLEMQDGEMTVNDMLGGETVNGDYFPDALYDALGSAVVDGDIVNKEHRIVDVETRVNEDEIVNEGNMSNILLATLLAIPGILPAKQIQKSIDTQPSYSYIVNDVNKKCRMVGDYTAFQAANIIARTLFAEARNDGKDGMEAVASVIYNRANGKISDFANVCKKHGYSKKAGRDIYQFSCWNKMADADWTPKNFKVKLPAAVKTGSKEQQRWEQAMEIAANMLGKGFKPTVKANMYYNDKTANPDWGKQLTDVKYVGSHKFGILKNHSSFI